MKEFREQLNKGKGLSCFWTGRLNIVILIFPVGPVALNALCELKSSWIATDQLTFKLYKDDTI